MWHTMVKHGNFFMGHMMTEELIQNQLKSFIGWNEEEELKRFPSTKRFTDFCPGAAFNAFLLPVFSHHHIKTIKITIHRITHGYSVVCENGSPGCDFSSIAVPWTLEMKVWRGGTGFASFVRGVLKNAIKLVMEWREHKKNKWRVRRRGRGRECQYSWGVTVEIWRLLFVCVCKA